MNTTTSRTVKRYAFSVLAVIIAGVITYLLRPMLEGTYTPLFFAAVTASSLLGGKGPGVVASLLSAFTLKWFLVAPRFSFGLEDFNDALRFILFFSVAFFLNWLAFTFRSNFIRLRQTVAELQQERDIRERFVYTLGHDLKTPLTSIKTASQLLRRMPEPVEVRERLLAQIEKGVDRTNHMIDDLLNANLIRAGQTLPLHFEKVNLNQLIRDVCEELTAAAGDRFHVDFPSHEIIGSWDREGIRRVLENLLKNAEKYGSRDKLITIRVAQDEHSVSLSIHNWGTPILPEDQKILFHPFARTQSAKTSGRKGWGIGLTLVKGIVEAHQGSVLVQSAEHTGTTFTIVLPLGVV